MPETGLLHVADVTTELKTTDLAIVRLIARRRIQANAVRENPSVSDWRITPDALAAYVKAGVPDLHMPEMNGAWFNTKKLDVGYGFHDAIGNAVKEQILDADAAKAFANQKTNRSHNTFDRLLTVTPAVRGIIEKPTPVSESFPSCPMPEPRLATWGDTYLALLLDIQIRKSLDPQASKDTPATAALLRLYQTPADYQERIREAIDAITEKQISFERSHQVTPTRRVTFRYIVPHTSIRTRQQMNSIADRAY